MIDAQADQTARRQLAVTVVDAKTRKDLSWHPLPAAAAEAVVQLLCLIPGGIPTDPTIYRFYEMLQVYGTTLKALVHEEFRPPRGDHPRRHVAAQQAVLTPPVQARNSRSRGRTPTRQSSSTRAVAPASRGTADESWLRPCWAAAV
jgi:hypothetical protein